MPMTDFSFQRIQISWSLKCVSIWFWLLYYCQMPGLIFFSEFFPMPMMCFFRCDPCDMVSTVYGLLQCKRSSELERIVKRGTLLDKILIDLGQPLPPQFDHGDFNFWIFNKNLHYVTLSLIYITVLLHSSSSSFWRLSLVDWMNLNVIRVI